MKSTSLPLAKIKGNSGQIKGLPRNPRFIKDDRYQKLKQSIIDLPEMLDLRELIVFPHKGEFVVIGGNMRLMALKELEHKTAPCKVLPETTPVDVLKAITIKDNINYGEHDFEALLNEWDKDIITDWGVEVDGFAFQPSFSPEKSGKEITQADMEKAQGKIDGGFTGVKPKIEVTCPECGNSFYINQ